MKKILEYIPGFRSNTTWKKVMASVFYVFIVLMSLIVGPDFFFIIGGLGLVVFSIIDLVKRKKNNLTIKAPIVSIIVAILLMNIGINMDSTEKKVSEGDNTKDTVETIKEDKPEEVNNAILDITGDLDIQFNGDKAIITITTNAIDGSIFETLITDANFNMVSDFIEVKDGKAVKEFEINKEWETGYLSSISSMRFNLDEHPQPKLVKDLYGENGENLKGDLAVENNLNGYNISLEAKAIAYPDEETVSAKNNELFSTAMSELISSSNGVIINIQPNFTDNDWSVVAVTLSDAWYNSQEYEKERFAETVGDTVKTVIMNTGQVGEGKNVSVYFYDSHQKELASPKIMGGYKIKR